MYCTTLQGQDNESRIISERDMKHSSFFVSKLILSEQFAALSGLFLTKPKSKELLCSAKPTHIFWQG